MNDETFEKIEFQPSDRIEEFFTSIGLELYAMLVSVERHDEIALMSELISSYAYAVSLYGDKTKRWPESLAVDLNEAALLKLSGNSEWRKFAEGFKNNIHKSENS